MDLVQSHSSFIILLAGISFMIYGLSQASQSIQKIAANRIRTFLSRLNENSPITILVGVALTMMMQSSGAVTATLVNLGTARVITLSKVMGVLIGSAIGAAFTVQLISLKVANLGLPLFILGFLASMFVTRSRIRDYCEFAMALGIMFFGFELIGIGSNTFVHLDFLSAGIVFLKNNPLLMLILSILLTSFFQSSTATIGVVMGLAGGGILNAEDAVFWVYGANVGTTSTALLAAMRGNYLGKRIAWANFLYRLATVVLFLIPAGPFLLIIKSWVQAPSQQIALFYTIMNLVAASIFFPLRHFGVKIIEKVVQPAESEKEFGVRFLKRSTYESFAMGLAHARREILEMGEIVRLMAEDSLLLFRTDDPEEFKKLKENDDRVDLLLREIKHFLIRVSELAPEGINQTVMDVISFGSDLEGAADIIDHNVAELAHKIHRHKLEFSTESWRELEVLHKSCIEAISLALVVFQTDDLNLASDLTEMKHGIRDLEKRTRENYLARLSPGKSENVATSTIYIEILSSYLQLVEVLSRQARRSKLAQNASNSISRSEKSSSSAE